jgi:hypothetical protein
MKHRSQVIGTLSSKFAKEQLEVVHKRGRKHLLGEHADLWITEDGIEELYRRAVWTAKDARDEFWEA